MEKYRPVIENIILGGPVLAGESFDPAPINFFYGKNGSGKTTAAEQFWDAGHIRLRPGLRQEDFEFLRYDETFIYQNVRSFSNLPGVFTISKGDAGERERLDSLNDSLSAARRESDRLKKEAEEFKNLISTSRDSLRDKTWRSTAGFRKQYPKAMAGYKAKNKFIEKISETTGKDYDLAEISGIYEAAFEGDGKKYEFYNNLQLPDLPSTSLLLKQIVGSESTPFAEFINALADLSWVKSGHDKFHAKAGDRCPYCMQRLPETFEADLASCFDEQYKKDMNGLNSFLEEYIKTLNRIYKIFHSNLSNGFECAQTESYKDKLNLFYRIGTGNIKKIRDKIASPVRVVVLDDINGVIAELVKLSREINDLIISNNRVAKNISAVRDRCKAMAWEKMAFDCREIFSEYNERITFLRREQEKREYKAGQLDKSISSYTAEIAALNTKTTGTAYVMEQINRMLDENGFRGFHLQENENAKFTYRLVRDDGNTAGGLSEGERRVISFLYFYFLVTGNRSGDGTYKDKIVVIDDPVSGLDPESETLTAGLVRNLVSACRNGCGTGEAEPGDGRIRQIFCLTHDPRFLEMISNGRADDYECVSFFELIKDRENKSRIMLCERPPHGEGGTTGRDGTGLSPKSAV